MDVYLMYMYFIPLKTYAVTAENARALQITPLLEFYVAVI